MLTGVPSCKNLLVTHFPTETDKAESENGISKGTYGVPAFCQNQNVAAETLDLFLSVPDTRMNVLGSLGPERLQTK